MLEFFRDLMTFTGGVLCVIFWLVVIPAITIELFDRAVDRKASKAIVTSEED